MELLRPMEEWGYPADYLCARVRVRMGYLIADWEPLLAAADPLAAVASAPNRRPGGSGVCDGEWESVLAEYAWAWGQMDKGLRRVFAPFFCGCVLQTMILVLRHRAGTRGASPVSLHTPGLLADRVRRTLEEADLDRLVEGVAHAVSPAREEYRRLVAAFRAHGAAGFEEALVSFALPRLAASSRHRLVASFFRYIIDSRNILAVAKHVRWRMEAPPRLLAEGAISIPLLARTAGRREASGVEELVDRLAGTRTEVATPELRLLAGLGRRLSREKGDSPGVGLILHYLWRVGMEGRNLRLLARWRELDRESIRREIVP